MHHTVQCGVFPLPFTLHRLVRFPWHGTKAGFCEVGFLCKSLSPLLLTEAQASSRFAFVNSTSLSGCTDRGPPLHETGLVHLLYGCSGLLLTKSQDIFWSMPLQYAHHRTPSVSERLDTKRHEQFPCLSFLRCRVVHTSISDPPWQNSCKVHSTTMDRLVKPSNDYWHLVLLWTLTMCISTFLASIDLGFQKTKLS